MNIKAIAARTAIATSATPIPIPAFAPPLRLELEDVFAAAVPELDAELVVPLAAEPPAWPDEEELIVGELDEPVEEEGKFQPFICTPWMTDPVPVIVRVVGTQDPDDCELMGVMTWPLVRLEKHSFAWPAAARIFLWYV